MSVFKIIDRKATEDQTLTWDCEQDIASIQIVGLEDAVYLDKVTGGGPPKETAATQTAIEFSRETDRIYVNTTKPITVVCDGTPTYEINREGLADAVVWNPWTEKAKGMADFGPDDGWKRMVCVEAGAVGQWLKLEGGDTWEGGQILRVL